MAGGRSNWSWSSPILACPSDLHAIDAHWLKYSLAVAWLIIGQPITHKTKCFIVSMTSLSLVGISAVCCACLFTKKCGCIE